MTNTGYLSRRARGPHGYSLVEVLIAVAIIGVTISIGAQFSTMFNSKTASVQRACQAQANAVLAGVENETYYRMINNFMPLAAARSFGAPGVSAFVGNGFAGSTAITAPGSWFTLPAADFVINAPPAAFNTGVPLQNSQLIEGSMRTLAAIYNTTPGVRCALGVYAPLTGIPITMDLQQDGAVITIQITPFLRTTGVKSCPAVSLNPMPDDGYPGNPAYDAFAPGSGGTPVPAGVESYGGAPAPQPVALDPTTQYANRGAGDTTLGFELTANVAYTPPGGAATSCAATQKFEYPPDHTPPPPPTISLVNSTNPALACVPFAPTSPATITIGYPGAVIMESGTQLLCRDLSWQENWDPNPAPYANTPCILGGAITATNPFPPDPLLQAFSRPLLGGKPYWQPCDLMPQCGIAPTTVTYSQAGNPNVAGSPQTLALAYAALPVGCVMNVEVVAVDTAGNSSVANVPANRAFLSTVVPAPANSIQQNTCGVFCPGSGAPGPWPLAATFPVGYYTCRAGGCCVAPAMSGLCTTIPEL